MEYYRILPDYKDTDLWTLGKLNDLDPQRFFHPGFLENIPAGLEIGLAKAGHPADFCFAEGDIPVCNAQVAEVLEEFGAQLIPVRITGREMPYFIVKVAAEVDCVDEEKSEFRVWEAGNDTRPEHVGDYRAFRWLSIDVDRTEGAHVFRLARFHAGLIASEKVVLQVNALAARGLVFQSVTEALEE